MAGLGLVAIGWPWRILLIAVLFVSPPLVAWFLGSPPAAEGIDPVPKKAPPPSTSKQTGRGRWVNYGDPGSLSDDEVRRQAVRSLSLPRDTGKQWWRSLGPKFVVDGQIGVSGRSREVAGRVISLAVHRDPKKQGTWLAGAAAGGIWRTQDAGKTWKQAQMPGYPTSLAVGAIAFGSDETVYAGTGDTSPQGLSGSGLLFSTDGGMSWTPFPSNLNDEGQSKKRPWLWTAVTGIVVGPKGRHCRGMISVDSLWVAVAEAGGHDRAKPKSGVDEDNFGLFYLPGCLQFDARPEFIRVFTGDAVSDLKTAPLPAPGAFPPERPLEADCVFAVRPDAQGLQVDRVCPHKHWAKDPIRTSIGPRLGGMLSAKVAAAPSNGATLYLGIEDQEDNVYLLRTDQAWNDGSIAWDTVAFDSVATSSDTNIVVGYCSWDPSSATPKKNACHHTNVLSVSPKDPNTLYAGSVALWECRGCKPGQQPTWTDMSYLTPPRSRQMISPRHGIHQDQMAMVWSGDESQGYRLVVSNDGGVWSTLDANRSKTKDRVYWSNHSFGLEISQIFRGALDRRRPEVVFAGTQDTGTIRRYMGWPGRFLERWRWIQGGDGVGVVVSHHDPALHWATLHESVLVDEILGRRTRLAMWRTRDAGLTFQRADLGLERMTNRWVPPFVQCPNPDRDVLLYGDQTLWRVEDFFKIPTLRAFEASSPPTWHRNYPASDHPLEITAVAFAPDEPNTPAKAACQRYVFAANPDSQVLRTESDGGSWTPVGKQKNWPDRTVSALAFATRDVLYAAIETYGGPHVVRIDLGTETDWRDVTPRDSDGKRVDLPFKSLAVVPPGEHVVLAGSTAGVWMSPNKGEDWCRLPMDKKTPDVWVEDLKVHPKTKGVYAFTFGRGVFRLDDVEEAASACQAAPQKQKG
jgi:hypothetical protein